MGRQLNGSLCGATAAEAADHNNHPAINFPRSQFQTINNTHGNKDG